MTPPPWLVIGWGNDARGDDALGRLALQALREQHGANPDFEWLELMQLQPEHALRLPQRRGVVFIDASLGLAAPFRWSIVSASANKLPFSHALSPQALRAVFERLALGPAPPCWLLEIGARQCELGAALSAEAMSNLQAALHHLGRHAPWAGP